MKNEDKTSHVRYYIFRHDKGENIRYRTGQGDWTPDFEKAELWADYDFAKNKAKYFIQALNYRDTAVIGKVVVSIDGMFPLEVVNANR